MKKILLIGALAVSTGVLITAFTSSSVPQKDPVPSVVTGPQDVAKWAVDKAHSNIKFAVTHMLVSEVEGTFKEFNGTIEPAKADFSDARINFTIEVASINTDNDKRDGHL